jgi:hypothetical protein
MKKWGVLYFIFTIILISNFFLCYNVEACKDIVAVGDATEGGFNLFMKVRDPSRPGLQVLTIVPKGYEYTYNHPWTGKSINYKTEHKYIGVATKGDTIPNIAKSGMSLSDVGIAYGDADSNSEWINPMKYAWDDFDWIRYACEKADDENEAIDLLTKDAVKKMHATGVSENLFVVGPTIGVVIEADAYRYKIKKIEDGIYVMSNYPKELWRSQIRKKLPIASSFDTVVEKSVRRGGVIRLKSIRGIRVTDIGKDFVTVKPIFIIHAYKTNSIGIVTKINLGERKTVGHYSVELLDISGNKAKLRVSYVYKAWEEKMLEYIQPKYGKITVQDMVDWSRLEREELDGLRPMCEEFYEYEAVAIYKIPELDYLYMSCGWFSPNHACSSIYIPFHICNTDIYDPYETGEAAQLSLDIYNGFDHDIIADNFSKVENVFFYEIDEAERISGERLTSGEEISNFLTIIDMGMQKQAFLTEKIWKEINKISNEKNKQAIINEIIIIWDTNYANSFDKMKNAILNLNGVSNSAGIIEKIEEIALDISNCRIEAAKAVGIEVKSAEEKYSCAVNLINKNEYEEGFNFLKKAYIQSDMLIKGQAYQDIENIYSNEEDKSDFLLYGFILLGVFGVLTIFLAIVLSFNNQKH